MKYLTSYFIFLLIVGNVDAQVFTGIYNGVYDGEQAIVDIKIDEDGYIGTFTLAGSLLFELEAYDVEPDRAEGYFYSEESDFQVDFKMEGNNLYIEWTEIDSDDNIIGIKTYHTLLKKEIVNHRNLGGSNARN